MHSYFKKSMCRCSLDSQGSKSSSDSQQNLIRLQGWADWSETPQGAHVRRNIFSCWSIFNLSLTTGCVQSYYPWSSLSRICSAFTVYIIRPIDPTLHCLSSSMGICINNLDQVIWLAENLKRAWHLNLFSMAIIDLKDDTRATFDITFIWVSENTISKWNRIFPQSVLGRRSSFCADGIIRYDFSCYDSLLIFSCSERTNDDNTSPQELNPYWKNLPCFV